MASMMMMNSATTASRVATRSGANASSAVRRVAAPVVSVGGFGCTAAARRSGGVSLSRSRNAVVVRAAEEGGEGSEGGGDGIAFEPSTPPKAVEDFYGIVFEPNSPPAQSPPPPTHAPPPPP